MQALSLPKMTKSLTINFCMRLCSCEYIGNTHTYIHKYHMSDIQTHYESRESKRLIVMMTFRTCECTVYVSVIQDTSVYKLHSTTYVCVK